MHHCAILFRLKADIPLGHVRTARNSLQQLVETLPGVEHFAVTHNLAKESDGYNLALFAVFQDKHACDIFLRHEEFARVWECELGPMVERRVVAVGDGAAR